MTKSRIPKTSSFNVTIDPKLLDYVRPRHDGYPASKAKADTVEAMRALGARDFPDNLWIEPKDWQDYARENDKNGTWPENFRNRFTNQSPTHECTCHALTQNAEIAWNRNRRSKGDAVFFSQLSIYSIANPGKWGGANMQQTLGIALENGFLPEHAGPGGVGEQKTKFKHTIHGTNGQGNSLNSSGPWIKESDFPSGWKETAKHFKPLEVINPSSWEQIICCILHGICVSVGRSGHAIPYVQVVWEGSLLRVKYSDSYDLHRFDSISNVKAGVGGSYAIYTFTTPDDWSKPAG